MNRDYIARGVGRIYHQTLPVYTYILMVLLFILFSWRLFSGDAALNMFRDNELQIGPIFSFFSKSISGLEAPLWMHAVLGGVPVYNFPQASAYYPFYFFVFDIYSTPLKSMAALHGVTLLHIAILQINVYILLRTLKISKMGSILGTTFIVFSLTTYEIMKWPQVMASFSWMPLYLAGLIRLIETPRKPSAAFLTIGAFSMMTYAMVGQSLIFAGLLTCFLFAGSLFATGGASPTLVFQRITSLSLALGIALLISAVVLFPVVYDLGNMVRWVASDHSIKGDATIPFKYFITDQLLPAEISSFIFPGGHRHDISHPYVGVLPILFALGAFVFKERHWTIVPFAVIALYSLLSAFGDNFGLAQLNYHIPIINKIREPSYFLLPFNLALGVLAAFGFDSLRRRTISIRKTGTRLHWLRYVAFVVAGLLLVACLFFCRSYSPALSVLLSIWVFFGATFLLPASNRQYAKIGCLVLFFCALAIQLITVVWQRPSILNSDYLRFNRVRLELALSKIGEMDPDRQFRVIFDDGMDRQAAAMIASYQGIRTLNSYVNPVPFTQFNELYQHSLRGDKYSKGLGAKFLLCETCKDVETHGYGLVANVAGYSIYVADEVLPHFYVTSNLVGKASDLNEYIAILSANELAKLPLILSPGDALDSFRAPSRSNCVLRREHHSLNNLVFVSYCREPAYFVLNEFFSDSWKVSLNGIPNRPLKVNGNQIGVRLDSSSSIIQFTYEPWSVRFSHYLFAVGCIGLLILIWRARPLDHRFRGQQ